MQGIHHQHPSSYRLCTTNQGLCRLSSNKALSMLSATSRPRQSSTAYKTVDHVRGDSPVLLDSCSQHSNISRQHSFTSCDSVTLNVFKMATSIPKWTPSWCHLWATEGTTFFKRGTEVGLLLRSSSLRGSATLDGVGVTVREGNDRCVIDIMVLFLQTNVHLYNLAAVAVEVL